MKNLVICVILLVSLLMSSCGLPQEKKPSSKNQLSITEKEELEKEGYAVVPGKIPRPYWNTKFYGYSHMQYD